MMRVIGIGRAALNRALKRGELAQCPHILTVSVGKTPPMGRPLDVPELRRVYWNAQPHVQAFILWALGTGARPRLSRSCSAEQIPADGPASGCALGEVRGPWHRTANR